MIRFSPGAWWAPLVAYSGGVYPRLLAPVLMYFTYCFTLYQICYRTRFILAADGQKLIAGCVTFLLVFRVNQCYTRLVKAQDLMVEALTSLRSMVNSALAYSVHCGAQRAGLGEAELEASMLLKVNIIRLAVAFAVSLKYHMRIAEIFTGAGVADKAQIWFAAADLIRIKSLLTANESALIEQVAGLYEEEPEPERNGSYCRCRGGEKAEPSYHADIGRRRHPEAGSSRRRLLGLHEDPEDDYGGKPVPLMLLQMLRGHLVQAICKDWGFPERYLNYNEMHLAHISTTFEGLNQLVLTPMPLPYLQLSKLLVLLFMLTFPLAINLDHGIWSNVVVPTLLGSALAGFEIVAASMENPLGDEAADMSLYEMIHEFEVECQATFELSVRDHDSIVQSWEHLGEHLGLADGAKLISKKKQNAHKAYTFDQFFEWSTLPRATVQYIMMQSGTVSTVDKHLLESTFKVFEDEDQSEESLSTGLEDPFIITRCLSLRGPNDHRRLWQRQVRILHSLGDPSSWSSSLRDRLRRASLRRGSKASSSDLEQSMTCSQTDQSTEQSQGLVMPRRVGLL
mmetsp:Transcript_132/g.291  ORF Transcript_132/g.291 Transcript_132/m.291 type:complete len:567 (-) Transcript_132:52-1752(-)